MRDLLVTGMSSPAAAVARLQAASDRPGADAPLARRQAYFAAVGSYSSMERQTTVAPVTADAIAQLNAMATKENCRSCELDVLIIKAQAALSGRNPNETVHILTAAIPLMSIASDEQQRYVHALRAAAYRYLGRFADGIGEVVPAIELADRLGYPAARSTTLNLQCVLNAYLGDYQRAEASAHQAYAIADSIGNKRLMAEIELNIGFIATLSGERDKQLAAYNRGLALTRGDTNLNVVRASLLSNLADYWLTKQDWVKAFSYSEQAIEISRQLSDQVGLAYGITNRGVARAHLGHVEAGITDVKEAIKLAEQVNMRSDMVGINNELVNIYASAGRYKEAFETLRQIEALQAEISKQTRDRAVLELQEQYSAESRQREIERLANANKIKEAELSAQKSQRGMWAALALVLALSTVLLVQWLARMRNANRRLTDDVAVLAEQSAHDPLTHAFNRRQGHLLLTRHSEATKSAPIGSGPTLGVMLLDIDFFKLVNDTYGHAAGDKVLVEVATRLRKLLREHDALIRWGGEEFLLLLPSVRTSSLPAVASRVLHAIADEPVVIGDQRIVVSVSAGCVLTPFGSITEMESLVELADLALYKAKISGRNRAICMDDATADVTAEQLSQDIDAARSAGHVRLETVVGPEVNRPQHVSLDGQQLSEPAEATAS